LVTGPLRDPESLNKPATPAIGDANMIGTIPGMDVHYGLLYGLIACVLAYVLFVRTPFGFATRIVGGNVRAARIAGLPVGRLIVTASFLGGACAGLAGMLEIAAVHRRANDSLVAGYGYAGILVAFLARQHPLAIVPIAHRVDAELGWWGVPLALLAGAIRISTPFLFVSLGECLTERSGRINLGLEGNLVLGAMSAYAVSYLSGSPWLGVLAAGGAGMALGGLHAWICGRPRVNDIAAGSHS